MEPNVRTAPGCGRSEPRDIGRLRAESEAAARLPRSASQVFPISSTSMHRRMQLFVDGRNRLDEGGCAISAAPAHPVQHQAVQGLA